jgi:hypothetical protein
LVAALTLAVAGAAAPWARAEIDFAAALSIPLDDDGRLFINVASNHYHADPDVVVLASRRLRRPVDEIPIILFLAQHSRRSPSAILDLRAGGRGWIDIFVSLGLPYSILFAELPPDPGPPYGKAWGYWKKHRNDPRARIVLTDGEFTDLVHLQVTTRALGIDAREAIRLRGKGKAFRNIAADVHRSRHGGKPAGRPGGKSEESAKEQGRGKPKSHQKP